MASPMTPPAAAPEFLAAHGWAGARIDPLAGDASFRRYFRVLRDGGHQAVLMDAPPPKEDPRPFVAVAKWLVSVGLSAPEILAHDLERGLLLLGDFGDDRLRGARPRAGPRAANSTNSPPTFWSICTSIRRCAGCRSMAAAMARRSDAVPRLVLQGAGPGG